MRQVNPPNMVEEAIRSIKLEEITQLRGIRISEYTKSCAPRIINIYESREFYYTTRTERYV